MSQQGRQDFTDKAAASLKPDSQKTTTEEIGDGVKGTFDSAASTLQPQSEKSTTQKAGDAFSSNSNNDDKSIIDQVKGAVGLGNNN